jgi:NADH dehydrogenase (ubiquinone) Fe-S protein 1
MLHECASAVAALDMGFLPFPSNGTQSIKFVYNLGADDYSDVDIPSDAFVVYQGHHGDRGAARADVVLPGAAYTEKAGTYVNFEGRMQQTRAAVSAPGDARDDWKIVRAVSEVAGAMLPYDDISDVQARLASVSPTFLPALRNKTQQGCLWLNGEYSKTLKGTVGSEPLMTSIKQHFMTDVISRASPTMARVVKARAAEGL